MPSSPRIPIALASSALVALVATSLLTVPSPGTAAPSPGRGGGDSKVVVPTLTARATLSADHLEAGPPSGAQATPANGRTGPFAGQVIPGFSAVVEGGNGRLWAMPDNGFGTKTNSTDFLLRIYKVKPDWETSDGSPGPLRVQGFISLRDPDGKVPFPIVNGATPERLLTGGDFDIESLVRAPDGTFWVGEEFGPFLLHVSASGKVLEAPYGLPDGKSPQHPELGSETPRIPASRGFEALAASPDGRWLYPVVEGAFTDDADKRRRWIYEFDTRAGAYTGQRWAYQVDDAANVVGDAFTVRKGRMLVLERDNYDGAAAVTKRVYEVDLRRVEPDGLLEKTLALDLLKIANPDEIGLATSPGAYGVSDPFSFPMVSVETVVGLRDGRLLIANDNNYPGDDARVPGTPDDTEMIVVDLRKQRAPAPHRALVIGHRGFSGARPEHTLAAYEQAILACADYIEPDLVSTKDGVLVARHEPEIGGTTNVADHPEFAARKKTKIIDGISFTGWFTEDFTLRELKTLRAKERLPAVRPQNTKYDGKFEIPTFQEVLDLRARLSRKLHRPLGVYPETKHPSYFRSIGLPIEPGLVRALNRNGLNHRGAPVFVQSFEQDNLRALRPWLKVPLVQLLDAKTLRPAGNPANPTYGELATPAGLRSISRYAAGVGPSKDYIVPRDADGRSLAPTSFVRDAHAAGLKVHPYTFRRENQFLPLELRSSTDPNGIGNLKAEIRQFFALGVDGVFTDNADIGVAARRR